MTKALIKKSWIPIFLLVLGLSAFGCSNKDSNNETSHSVRVNKAKATNLTLSLTLSSINDPNLSATQIGDLSKKITVNILGQASPGSGVLIARDNQQYSVLTAWHVLKGQRDGEEISIQTFDGKYHDSNFRSIRKIEGVDMAIIDFKSNQNYQVVKIGNVSLSSPGDEVFVAGFPLPTSAVPRSIFRLLKGNIVANTSELQPDGYQLMYSNPTLPGMSGGAVLSKKGALIGMHGKGETDIILSEQSGIAVKTGINQAVPISYLLDNVSGLKPSASDYVNNEVSSLVSTASERVEFFNSFSKSLHLFERYDQNKLRGFQEIQAAILKQAIYLMTDAINNDKNNAYNYYLRGLYRELGRGYFSYLDEFKDVQLVTHDYDMAIKLDPDLARAYVRRARIDRFHYKGNASDEYFRRAIDLDPYLEEAYLEYSDFLRYKSGFKYSKSFPVVKEGLERIPASAKLNARFANHLRMIALQKINLEHERRIVNGYKDGTLTEENYSEKTSSWNKELRLSKEYIEQLLLALKHLDVSLNIDPIDRFPFRRIERGEIRAEVGNYLGAIEDMSYVISQSHLRRYEGLFRRHTYYIEAGMLEEALDDLNTILKLNICDKGQNECYFYRANTLGYVNDLQFDQIPFRKALLLKEIGRDQDACSELPGINKIQRRLALSISGLTPQQLHAWFDVCNINDL